MCKRPEARASLVFKKKEKMTICAAAAYNATKLKNSIR